AIETVVEVATVFDIKCVDVPNRGERVVLSRGEIDVPISEHRLSVRRWCVGYGQDMSARPHNSPIGLAHRQRCYRNIIDIDAQAILISEIGNPKDRQTAISH